MIRILSLRGLVGGWVTDAISNVSRVHFECVLHPQIDCQAHMSNKSANMFFLVFFFVIIKKNHL